MRGRFAPSPTGDLHLGNLRTALVAWLAARHEGSGFVLRFEDLDQGPVRAEYYDSQRRDLERLGLDWDDELRQIDHLDRYEAAVAHLEGLGLTYPCYCSRRDIREATQAPHGEAPDGAYPGTCRSLSAEEVAVRAADEGVGASVRLRSPRASGTVVDGLQGRVTASIDDVVLRRRDGVVAYNLAVVVDDAHQGIEEVVRGDDLSSSSPRQAMLAELLGLPPVAYLHVPLVLGPQRRRLAKRDGAVTLADRVALGESPASVRTMLARSLGLDASESDSPTDLATRFDRARLSRDPWTIGTDRTSSGPDRRGEAGVRGGTHVEP